MYLPVTWLSELAIIMGCLESKEIGKERHIGPHGYKKNGGHTRSKGGGRGRHRGGGGGTHRGGGALTERGNLTIPLLLSSYSKKKSMNDP